MNIIEHIEIMECDGWCDGCKYSADYCRKMYNKNDTLPPCLTKEQNERTV